MADRLCVNVPQSETRRLTLAEDRDMWKRYATAAMHDPRLQMCGMVSTSGPNLEPLACAYPDEHDGPHSWATLPTFVDGVAVPCPEETPRDA